MSKSPGIMGAIAKQGQQPKKGAEPPNAEPARRGRVKRRLTETDDRVVQTTVPYETYVLLNTLALRQGTPLRHLVREALVMVLQRHAEKSPELERMIKQLDLSAN